MLLRTTVSISDKCIFGEQQLALTAFEAGLEVFVASGSSPHNRLLEILRIRLTVHTLWEVPSRLRQKFLLFFQHR